MALHVEAVAIDRLCERTAWRVEIKSRVPRDKFFFGGRQPCGDPIHEGETPGLRAAELVPKIKVSGDGMAHEIVGLLPLSHMAGVVVEEVWFLFPQIATLSTSSRVTSSRRLIVLRCWWGGDSKRER